MVMCGSCRHPLEAGKDYPVIWTLLAHADRSLPPPPPEPLAPSIPRRSSPSLVGAAPPPFPTIGAPTAEALAETLAAEVAGMDDGVAGGAASPTDPTARCAIVVAVDHSGSMEGPKMANAAAGAAAVVRAALERGDAVGVLSFSSAVSDVLGGLRRGAAEVDAACEKIAALRADGSTALYHAIEAGVALLETSPEAAGCGRRALIVVTDGEHNVGETAAERQQRRLAAANLLARPPVDRFVFVIAGINLENQAAAEQLCAFAHTKMIRTRSHSAQGTAIAAAFAAMQARIATSACFRLGGEPVPRTLTGGPPPLLPELIASAAAALGDATPPGSPAAVSVSSACAPPPGGAGMLPWGVGGGGGSPPGSPLGGGGSGSSLGDFDPNSEMLP